MLVWEGGGDSCGPCCCADPTPTGWREVSGRVRRLVVAIHLACAAARRGGPGSATSVWSHGPTGQDGGLPECGPARAQDAVDATSRACRAQAHSCANVSAGFGFAKPVTRGTGPRTVYCSRPARRVGGRMSASPESVSPQQNTSDLSPCLALGLGRHVCKPRFRSSLQARPTEHTTRWSSL